MCVAQTAKRVRRNLKLDKRYRPRGGVGMLGASVRAPTKQKKLAAPGKK